MEAGAAAAEREIIAGLGSIDLRSRPYSYEAAEAVAELIVRAYDHCQAHPVREGHLMRWRAVHVVQAIGYLCGGFLSASAGHIGSVFETAISVKPRHLAKLREEFDQVRPHLERAVRALRDPGERSCTLQRYRG